MKICKYCKEQIHEEASKCPKCQSFQNKFLSPLFLSLIPLLFLSIFLIPLYMSFSNRAKKAKFIDHRDNIEMIVLKQDTLKKEDSKKDDLLNIVMELDNKTEIEWSQAEFEIEFKTANGELLNIEKSGDYRLTLHPNSKSKSAIKIPIRKEFENAEIKVELVNLKHKWY